MSKPFFAALVALAVAAALCGGAQAASVAEALSDDAALFVEIPSVPALRRLDPETSWGRIMTNAQVGRFLAEGFPALDILSRRITEATGMTPGEILDMCQGEAAMAVMLRPGLTPAAVIVIEVGADAASARAFVDGAAARLAPSWQEDQIPGGSVKYVQAGGAVPAYAFVDNYLVVSSAVEELVEVARGLRSGRQPNLADDPAFGKSLSVAGADQAELLVYVDFERVSRAFMAAAPPQAARALDAAGIAGLGSITYASRPSGKGVTDRLSLYFPNGRRGLFATLAPVEGEREKYLSMIPSDALSAMWMQVDFQAIARVLRSAVEAAAPPEQLEQIGMGVAMVEMMTGVQIEKDLLGSLGRNVITYTPKPSFMMGLALSGGIGQQVAMVELADEERFSKALASAWTFLQSAQASRKAAKAAEGDGGDGGPLGAAEFLTQTFGGRSIHVMRVPLPQVPAFQVTPAMAVNRGWLLVASNEQAIKDMISAPEKPARNILANNGFTNASAMAGPGNAGATYNDTKSVFEQLYTVASTMLPIAMMQYGGQMPIEPALLPDGRAIAASLFSSASSLNVDAQSIRLTSYGPIGDARGVYAAVTAAAAVAAWYQEVQQGSPARRQAPVVVESPAAAAAAEPAGGATPEEERARRVDDLATIGRAFFVYSRGHGGNLPGDLGEIDSPAYLRDTEDGVAVDLTQYRYVPGLTLRDDARLILVFARSSGPAGMAVLLANLNVMHLADGEVAEQVGGWLSLDDDSPAADLGAACMENVRILGQSVLRYAASRDERAPASLDWKTWYLFAPLATTCPAAAGQEKPHYATFPGMNIATVPTEQKSDVILVYETGARHDGTTAAAFLDGSVRLLSESELRRAITMTRLAAGSR